MHEAEKLSLDQIEAFLNASEEIRFEGENRQQVYGWVEQVLRQQHYPQQGRKARGLLRRYLEKMTGLSRAQVTRLIAHYRAKGELQPAPYRRHRFPQRYTRADIELLATVDEAHETLSGPATRGILCAKDTKYVRAVGKRWMISLIARLFRPGCKADHVLMLEGPQGKLKSTVFAVLVGDEHFTDGLSDLGSKDSMLEMAAMWLIELSEIENYLHDARSRNRFKNFVTRRSDFFREPYGRRPVAHLRHCVLAATTNSAKTLADPTGTRRIWPVECGKIDLDPLRKDADQLLAETKVCFDNGEPWWLETEDLEKLAADEQEERYEPGVWDDNILEWIAAPTRRETLEGGGSYATKVPVDPWDQSESGK